MIWLELGTACLVALALIATIIAGALRLQLRPGDFGECYDRVVYWVKVAQVFWALASTAIMVLMAVRHL